MDTAKIHSIILYKDNKHSSYIKVICNKCKSENIHSIEVQELKNKTVINLDNWGSRACENLKCDADYVINYNVHSGRTLYKS